jgi:hypothetical protein
MGFDRVGHQEFDVESSCVLWQFRIWVSPNARWKNKNQRFNSSCPVWLLIQATKLDYVRDPTSISGSELFFREARDWDHLLKIELLKTSPVNTDDYYGHHSHDFWVQSGKVNLIHDEQISTAATLARWLHLHKSGRKIFEFTSLGRLFYSPSTCYRDLNREPQRFSQISCSKKKKKRQTMKNKRVVNGGSELAH